MARPTFEELFDPAIAAGMLSQQAQLPGVPNYLQIRITEVTPGRCVAEMPVRDELLNPFGAMHGAAVAALVDHVLGSAVYPMVPAGTWPASLEFKLNYLAPVRRGVVRAESTIVALRSRTAVARIDVTNEGEMVATALGTISLNPPKPAGPDAEV